jgi:hypothetical protein
VPIDLTAVLPPTAVAAIVNLTAAGPAAPGHLTAFTCGEPVPAGSSVNIAGATRAAAANVRLDDEQRLCVRAHATTEVIVDVQAALVPAATPGSLRMQAPAAPQRLADTRLTGRAPTLRVAVPGAPAMVAVNLTATGSDQAGHLTAHACDAPPPAVSNVNFTAGATVAGLAHVAVGAEAAICVSAPVPVDVVVDLTATFASDATLGFQPVAAARLLDTRTGLGGWVGRPAGGQTLDATVAPAGAAAVTGTLTAVAPNAGTYLTLGPAGSAYPTSNVNAAAGEVVANAVSVAAPDGRVAVFARAAGHVVFDVSGWWLPV